MVRSYYDDPSFDYLNYWQERGYEHLAEKISLKELIDLIPFSKRGFLLDLGAGFGRLTDLYAVKFKKAVLLDPSEKLLNKAKNKFKAGKNLDFKQGRGDKIPFSDQVFDLVLMIRVLHHLEAPEKVIKEISRVLKPGGFLILEFANKAHFKAKICSLFDFKQRKRVFSLEPVNFQTKKETIPFFNYHPFWIENLVKEFDFELIKKLSCSNFRHSGIKKGIPARWLLLLEKKLQFWLGKINFGPSIFLLLRKK